VQKGKFPVVGFVKDPTGVAALYLGKQEAKNWFTWASWELTRTKRRLRSRGSATCAAQAVSRGAAEDEEGT